MSEYRFYDTDVYGKEEYDITGEHYLALIDACFKYSSVFSFRLAEKDIILSDELEKYRVDVRPEYLEAYRRYFFSELRCYRVCDETKKLFLSIADGVFKWVYAWGYTNPEDPAFFRLDGSVFFYSVVHEGECTLLPRDNEDIRSVLSYGKWEQQKTKKTGDG